MGWNQGYTIYEATIVAAYNAGKLDKELLAAIMEPYRGSDIDHGGETGLKTKDGKSADQVAVEAFGLKWLSREEDHDGEKNYEAFRKVSDHLGWD
jgi:hypothetical protein